MKGNTRLLFWGGAALIALVVIGMVLQAIRNLLWDLSYWLPAWMVGPVLLLGAALIVTVLTQLVWPWYKGWKQQSRSGGAANNPSPAAPDTRRQAAEQSLESIDRLLDRLKDDVSREGLRQERERVAQEQVQNLRNQYMANEATLRTLRDELGDRRSRHQSLSELMASFEGMGDGVRAIMQRGEAPEPSKKDKNIICQADDVGIATDIHESKIRGRT